MERPEVPPGRKSWSIQEEMAEASADNLIKVVMSFEKIFLPYNIFMYQIKKKISPLFQS